MASIALIGATATSAEDPRGSAPARTSVVGIVRHPEKLSAQPRFTIARGDIANRPNWRNICAGRTWWSRVCGGPTTCRSYSMPCASPASRADRGDRCGQPRASPGVRVIDTPDSGRLAFRRRGRGACARHFSLREGIDGCGFAVLEYHARRAHRQISSRRRSAVARFGSESRISREDFAVAIVDEIERPKHHCQRITVATDCRARLQRHRDQRVPPKSMLMRSACRAPERGAGVPTTESREEDIEQSLTSIQPQRPIGRHDVQSVDDRDDASMRRTQSTMRSATGC